MAELKVELGADIKKLLKGLDTAEKELKGLDKTATATQKKVGNFGKTSATGINKLNKATANANPTLQEFSRVIQDAPYGIQGVGNNITQLVSQFGYLSKASGGASGAIKALAGSFLGAGGILFLISTAVSLLTVYGDKLFAAVDDTNGLAKATGKLVGEAKAEIVTLRTLVKLATDESTSKELQTKAREKLNKDYGKLLGNLDAEIATTSQLKNAVDALSKSYLVQAKLQGAKDAISEITSDSGDESVELSLDLNATKKRLRKEFEAVQKDPVFKNFSVDSTLPLREQIQGFQDYLKTVGNNRGKASQFLNSLIPFDQATQKLADFEQDLNDSIKPLIEIQEDLQGQDLLGGLGSDYDGSEIILTGKKVSKAAKEQAAKLASELKKLYADIDADLALLDIEEFEQQNREIEGIFKASGAAMAADAKEREQLIDLTKSVNEVEEFQKKLNEVRNLLGDSEFDFSTIISNDDIDAFIGRLERATEGAQLFGDAVGASISQVGGIISEKLETGNAVIDAFIGTFISGLSQMAASALQSLILNKALAKLTQSVEYGKSAANGITIATSAAAALGPAGLPALPGLIAGVQATIAGAFAGIQSFAKGSGGFSGDNNLAMLNRNEMILRPMEQSALYNSIRNHNLGSVNNGVGAQNISSEQVQWRLEGTDIVGSVRNTMRKNTRTGGSLTL